MLYAAVHTNNDIEEQFYHPFPVKNKTLPQSQPATIKPMLAKSYGGENPSGWLMSEKLDGVRAIWDGQQLKSRNGNVFHAPGWFLEKLPSGVILDGELWEGRGRFQQTVGKVRAKAGDWSGIRFMVFDVVNDQPYRQRLELLRRLNLAHVVEQTLCLDAAHLLVFEDAVLAQGGEGVMLRQPNSRYEHKRSAQLLKVKRFKTDEAEVTGYTHGLGRLAGSVGALVCRRKTKVFQVGSGLSDALRESPPDIGSTITFRFFDYTDGGAPRHPVFVGVRDYE